MFAIREKCNILFCMVKEKYIQNIKYIMKEIFMGENIQEKEKKVIFWNIIKEILRII